jgi:hypothetical protein
VDKGDVSWCALTKAADVGELLALVVCWCAFLGLLWTISPCAPGGTPAMREGRALAVTSERKDPAWTWSAVRAASARCSLLELKAVIFAMPATSGPLCCGDDTMYGVMPALLSAVPSPPLHQGLRCSGVLVNIQIVVLTIHIEANRISQSLWVIIAAGLAAFRPFA